MGREQNFGLGSKFSVRRGILGQKRNFGLGAKFWVGGKIFGLGENFHVEVGNIRVGGEILGSG